MSRKTGSEVKTYKFKEQVSKGKWAVFTRVPTACYEQLKKQATEQKRSISQQAALILEEHLRPALQRDWSKFRLITKSSRHSQREPDKCSICGKLIEVGQQYYDAGSTGKVHRICVEAERK